MSSITHQYILYVLQPSRLTATRRPVPVSRLQRPLWTDMMAMAIAFFFQGWNLVEVFPKGALSTVLRYQTQVIIDAHCCTDELARNGYVRHTSWHTNWLLLWHRRKEKKNVNDTIYRKRCNIYRRRSNSACRVIYVFSSVCNFASHRLLQLLAVCMCLVHAGLERAAGRPPT